jgi:hypothetical protein
MPARTDFRVCCPEIISGQLDDEGRMVMLRMICGVVLVLALFAGNLLAVEGVFVRFENHDLVVKVADKERTIEFKHVEVYSADGALLVGKNIGEALQAGTKVELTEKDGKVVKVQVKK